MAHLRNLEELGFTKMAKSRVAWKESYLERKPMAEIENPNDSGWVSGNGLLVINIQEIIHLGWDGDKSVRLHFRNGMTVFFKMPFVDFESLRNKFLAYHTKR